MMDEDSEEFKRMQQEMLEALIEALDSDPQLNTPPYNPNN